MLPHPRAVHKSFSFAVRIDVVLLQEVVNEVLPILAAGLPAYRLLVSDQTQGYFTAILLHTESTSLVSQEVTRFANTQMDRMLHVAKVPPRLAICPGILRNCS
jgi:hypothetical protein